ncbi:MAG: SGNH hydrolase domain-containing protein [Nocardioidaceae bacterium]
MRTSLPWGVVGWVLVVVVAVAGAVVVGTSLGDGNAEVSGPEVAGPEPTDAGTTMAPTADVRPSDAPASAPSPADVPSPDPADDPGHATLTRLRPSVATAPDDKPRVYDDGCHATFEATTARPCTYGDRSGTRVVVALGDSLMAQWFSAIDGAARTGGWRLVWLTKSGCPAHDASVTSKGRYYQACDTWRSNALAEIRGLPRVDLLVIGGSANASLLQRGSMQPVEPDDWSAAWRNGADRVARGVRGQVRRLAIMRDTPAFSFDVPDCLQARNGSTGSCSRAPRSVLSARAWSAEQSVDAAYSWVRATELTAHLCSDRCRPVTSNHVLRYRDRHHLTDTYVRAMTPALHTRLSWLMR